MRSWELDTTETAALLDAYQGRTWPTPVDVADWLVGAAENHWDIRPWTVER